MKRRNSTKCFLFVLCLATAAATQAQIFTTLYNFAAPGPDNSQASLVQGFNGQLYGTTVYGGRGGDGTIFAMSPSGTVRVVHNFDGADGASPWQSLVLGNDGNYYGTANYGGTSTGCSGGCGTVFKVTPTGVVTTLYSFCSLAGCIDGVNPQGGMTLGNDGNFYGTTLYGGTQNSGTFFRITPTGTLTTLYSFGTLSGDGLFPYDSPIQASDGNFYGTLYFGGPVSGWGTIYRITPDGTETDIYDFCSEGGCLDGKNPVGGLIQGSDGNLYGTTVAGGADNQGGVFQVTLSGAYTVIHNFHGGDGAAPIGRLVEGSNGQLYGTTSAAGGAGCNCGTIFGVSTTGSFKLLHSLTTSDGSTPVGGLVQDTNATFYGTTAAGGTSGQGTIFSLAVGLKPFVAPNPMFGSVGTPVIILGTNLTGATNVTFNGTAATFTVVSATEITTTVPTGASTGVIQVTTPHGTLSSNAFIVN